MVGKTVLFITTSVFDDDGIENKGDGVTKCYTLFNN